MLAMNSPLPLQKKIYGISSREFYENYSTAISKQKESLLKERERLVGEIETMRQRMRNMSAYTEELEKKGGESEQRINELHETIEMQLNELSHEKRGRERTETEMRQLQNENAVKKTELEVRNNLKRKENKCARQNNFYYQFRIKTVISSRQTEYNNLSCLARSHDHRKDFNE